MTHLGVVVALLALPVVATVASAAAVPPPDVEHVTCVRVPQHTCVGVAVWLGAGTEAAGGAGCEHAHAPCVCVSVIRGGVRDETCLPDALVESSDLAAADADSAALN